MRANDGAGALKKAVPGVEGMTGLVVCPGIGAALLPIAMKAFRCFDFELLVTRGEWDGGLRTTKLLVMGNRVFGGLTSGMLSWRITGLQGGRIL